MEGDSSSLEFHDVEDSGDSPIKSPSALPPVPPLPQKKKTKFRTLTLRRKKAASEDVDAVILYPLLVANVAKFLGLLTISLYRKHDRG